ncbi:3,4-dihydroxy-2-butanone-4-phosphate synthase [Halobellus sp. GM3]|uniref:3,4-dihydroxy-2-butanone-4-phosphate synthase n=1 Tax=Halobellus sp. GM3 TaxID=3458410 RepID=UPI00403D8C9E
MSGGFTGLKDPVGDLDDAVAAFEAGEPVLIHDATERENEIDIVYPASAVTPTAVSRMRNDAGGLICVALSDAVAREFDLPFLADSLDHPVGEANDLAYDDRSSFSLPVNHSETYTGITDNDRALTITMLAAAARDPAATDFATEFNAPGHVHLLKAAPGLLEERQGHTEFGVALAERAGVPQAAVVCEMLDDRTGEALSRQKAVAYAREEGLVFIDGSTITNRIRSGVTRADER